MVFMFLFYLFCDHGQTVEILDELVEKGSETMDVRNKDEVVCRIKAAVASKQFGQEDILCPLIADVSTWNAYLCANSPSLFFAPLFFSSC